MRPDEVLRRRRVQSLVALAMGLAVTVAGLLLDQLPLLLVGAGVLVVAAYLVGSTLPRRLARRRRRR